MFVDWSDPKSPISKHFTVKEALWLPSWGRMANETDGLNDEIKSNLIKTFTWMDQVRDHFNAPICVHVTYRPEAYNALVKGAKSSQHLIGCAIDFDVQGLECKDAIQDILDNGLLESIQLRMENNGPEPTWIHLDSRIPGSAGRYFKP